MKSMLAINAFSYGTGMELLIRVTGAWRAMLLLLYMRH